MSLRTALPQVNVAIPGPKAKAWMDKRAEVMPAAIKPFFQLVIERGEGAMIEDVDGNVLLDWIAGVGVMNIGYSVPELIDAVNEQAGKYFHSMMNITTNTKYLEFADEIAKIAPVRGDAKQVMLVNTGAESVENAVKIARGATGRPNVIVFTGAFHGRTALTMTMTAKKAYALGMGPFPDGIYRAEFPYTYRAPAGLPEEKQIDYFIEKLEMVFETQSPAKYVAAIVFEPLQGEGGFVPAPLEWVKAIRKICDDNGIMMVADEVQTGFARTGRMFASDYYKEGGFAPDIMTFAKSVAGGLPLGGVVTSKEIMDKVPAGTIGGTYNGNALACASALKVLEVMKRDDYPAKARKIGEVCMKRFNEWKNQFDIIGNVRGMGAMMGIEFIKDADKTPNNEIVGKIIQVALQKGLMIEPAGTYGNVLRFLCPICVTDEQLEAGLDIFEASIKECL